jgi:hypothetical protein
MRKRRVRIRGPESTYPAPQQGGGTVISIQADVDDDDIETATWDLVAIQSEVAAMRAEVAALLCRLEQVLFRLED